MSIKIYHSKDFPSYLPKLNKLYDDLFSGGKGFRSKLIGYFCKDLSIGSKEELLMGQTIEFIHNASLLHDDLVDRSQLRRGKPAAWVKYTPEYAVLAGDYLLARVMANLASYGNLRLIQYTANTISDLLEGEWIQDSLVYQYNVDPKTLDKVHILKTGSLFKWCLKAPFMVLEDYREELHNLLEELGGILGVLFQRGDDLLDFGIRNAENKSVLGDLKSGYLNSFGVFLFSSVSTSERNKLKNSESLLEFTRCYGEEAFTQKVVDFDSLNTDMITLYQHKLEVLMGLLPEGYSDLHGTLQKLPELLYWRKKP